MILCYFNIGLNQEQCLQLSNGNEAPFRATVSDGLQKFIAVEILSWRKNTQKDLR